MRCKDCIHDFYVSCRVRATRNYYTGMWEGLESKERNQNGNCKDSVERLSLWQKVKAVLR